MKITLFCVLVFWTICMTTSREIPQQYSRNARIAKELNELEHLLKEREYETHNPSDVEGETTLQEPEEEEERELEAIQGRFGKRHLDRPSKSYARKMEESMQKLTHRERLLAERKMKEWRKSNGDLPEPENIDPDDPESNLLEGMEIENNGHPHLVQGLHPEKSAKTYGDSHDSHKLIPEQEALAKKSGDSSGRKRNFDTYTPWLWKDGIVPYSMFNMSSSAVTVINKAIKQVNDYTCVKWVPTSDPRFNPTTLGHSNVVTFINEGGCWSYVGNVNPFRNNVQPVSLSEPGCISVSTSVHEMLHAMGGHHEQSRSDRDGYVSIAWPNVKPSWNGTAYVPNNNMAKSNTQDNNPYDAESSMQYSLYAFSNNGQKTILFKDQRLEFLADSAEGLEFYDIQDVTDAYKCTDHCTNKPNCQNGGFVNFQCTCTCPDVLTGTTCEQTVSNSQTCGGVINLAAGEERLIQSPNYPSNYPTGLECTWLIKGPANSLVRASVQYMDLTSGSACSHWLEYRYNLLGQKGPKVCGTNFVADVEKWDSSPDELSNAMIIRFDSNTYSSASVSKGFSIKVSTIGAGCLNNPCVFGTCSSPLNSGTYTCACNPGVTGTNCDQLTPSYQLICTFEFGEKCPFENEGSNAINWDTNSQGTPSSNTGPSNAHGGFQYVYTEMSGKNPGDKATMSTTSQLPTTSRCMTFYYHMKGSTMGTLNIYSEGTNTAKYNIWTRSGAQGDDWIKAEIDIPAINGLKMTIEGVRGSNWSSDIAIDDVSLIPGTCGNPVTSGPTTADTVTAAPTTASPATPSPTTPSPTTAAPNTAAPTTASPTTSQPTDGTQTCTFEDGAPCFLVEATNDDFDWTSRSGSTPSGGTGPQSAVEGSKYKYVEVSSPRASNNDVARLESSTNLNGDYCLTFQYHMFGLDTMGDLKISTGVTAPENEVFIKSGNLGDQWNKGMVTITGAAGMKLFIEANKVTSWKGDIAIDDIKLMPVACAGVSPCDNSPCLNGASCSDTTTAIGYTCSCLGGFLGQNCDQVDGKTVSEFTCDFKTENNCVFENVDDDDFQWTYRSGPTPSSGTGPSSAYEGTKYVYTEVSSPRGQGDTAVLSTVNTLLAGTSSYCLQFYLHMYGNPGTMEVKFGNRDSSSSSVWSESNDQGNQWVFHQVELPPSFTDPVIFFEAIRGSSYRGDIALDSLKLSLGQCASGPSACSANPCNNGGSCSEDAAGYYCNCMTGWSGDNCDVQDVPGNSYSCGFETVGATCIFKDTTNDQFDWTRRTKSTPSSSTGPSSAATGDYYMYIETSTPRVNGDTAVLSTQDTNLPAGSWCLTFQYHMKGSSTGSLRVFAGDRSSSLTSIWTKSGEQSDPDLWKTATIDIPQQSNPVITIDGIRGSSYRGDIAIDDIALNAGTCASAGK
ncbi:MAM and LDL-receptor class A domain-containing protein 1-like isoform X2 [Mytilus galloprovincialis]|uniref:MAM and LDL-receptor class A domain-containing protein 1-like isoform X2 n=1 Tax=Mytilus galloprovincialis TaxID=29158 RepID=UPI003F7C7C1A